MIFLALLDLLLNLDKHLGNLIAQYGSLVYGLLFLIIFCETGLVVTPFLPGDSLLFAAGAFAALGSLNIYWLFGLLLVAAILGDTVNYWIGHSAGEMVVKKLNGKIINPSHLERAHKFYEKYGAKMIVLARFVPIVRTFAPFVAGVSKMTYAKFISYNIIGGVAWVSLFVFGGYFFGNLPVVRDNFSLVILVIIVLSVLPMIYEGWRARRDKSIQT